MCLDYPTCASSKLDVGNQQFSLSQFNYGSGTVLSNSNYFLDVNLVKATSYPSNSSLSIYWGIAVPTNQPKGTYTGQNTISAIAN